MRISDWSSDVCSSDLWTLSRSAFYKNDLLQLDILANALWDRPVYFASTIPGRNMLGMDKYLRNDGLALRVTPVPYNNNDPYLQGSVNDSILYDNLMNKFKWGGLETGNIYIDPETRRMLEIGRASGREREGRYVEMWG